MFSLEEKETVLRYDSVEKRWYVFSRVSKHINRMRKMGFNMEILAETEAGTPLEAKGTAEEKQISFRRVIELTTEQLQQRSEIAKQALHTETEPMQ